MFDATKDLVCPLTGKRLWTDQCLVEFNKVLQQTLEGRFSDPVGVVFFYEKGKRDGLTTYYCGRSTSDLEGWHVIESRDMVGGYGTSLTTVCFIYHLRVVERNINQEVRTVLAHLSMRMHTVLFVCCPAL